jgi:hypothetical protein
MGIHIAYCVRAEDPVIAPPWEDDAAVPTLRELSGPALAKGLRADGVLPVTWDGLRAQLPLPRLAAALLARVDGKRSWGEIAAEVVAGGATPEQVARDRAELSRGMERLNRMLLAAPAG